MSSVGFDKTGSHSQIRALDLVVKNRKEELLQTGLAELIHTPLAQADLSGVFPKDGSRTRATQCPLRHQVHRIGWAAQLLRSGLDLPGPRREGAVNGAPMVELLHRRCHLGVRHTHPPATGVRRRPPSQAGSRLVRLLALVPPALQLDPIRDVPRRAGALGVPKGGLGEK